MYKYYCFFKNDDFENLKIFKNYILYNFENIFVFSLIIIYIYYVRNIFTLNSSNIFREYRTTT